MTMDVYLAYLRVAFHCCYYCAVVADRADELQRKCVKHLRGRWSTEEMAELNRSAKRKGVFASLCPPSRRVLNKEIQNAISIGSCAMTTKCPAL